MPETTAQLLGSRYRLIEPIARGGMAVVWQARDERLGRTVAVKVLHTRLAADDSFRERFRREAVATASFNHPNIVTVFDTGNDSDTHYIVMEFVEGPSLSRLLGKKATLSPAECVTMLHSVLSALAYSHERGVIHRDIKPANILLSPRPAPGVIKVGDFGIARALAAKELTATGAIIGTASYLSPEQAEGRRVDHRADLYSLACVAYRCLTARLPWDADNEVGVALARTLRPPEALMPLSPASPRRLVHVIETSLARDPAARYQSAAEMAAALGNLRGAHIAVNRRAGQQQSHDASPNTRPTPSSPATPAAPFVSHPSISGPGTAGVPVGNGSDNVQAIHIGELPAASAASAASVRYQTRPQGARHAPRTSSAGSSTNRETASQQRRAASRQQATRRAQRAQRTRRATAIAIIAGIVIAVIAIAIPTGKRDRDAPPTTNVARSPITVAADFDPAGDNTENPRSTEAAHDGNLAAGWRTELYNTRDFGNLKDGVGIAFDLGQQRKPGTVTVSISPGTSFDIRTSDNSQALKGGLDDWHLVPSSGRTDVHADGNSDVATVQMDTGARDARYWLIWITRLPPGTPRSRTEVFEVAFGGG